MELTKRSLKTKYLGSYLGIYWSFIHPLAFISVIWFVFEIGLKIPPMENCPFIIWLMAGIIPWFFFSDGISTATNSILEDRYLVKEIVFSVAMLPIVKIISSLIVHIFFIFVMLLVLFAYGYYPNLYYLQAVYYLVATLVLVTGLSWLTSALVIFLRDIGQIVSVILQFGFWLTPIFWSAKILPQKYLIIVKLNPVYYLVEGYRESFIYKVWFWEHWLQTINFWLITGTLFIFGALIFRRLKPHFADIL
jgi:lipopolysaccharide transport system permease protein